MAENRMADVAALFGKVIGERFRVNFLSENREGVFTESGLQTKDLDVWHINNAWLNYLLTGEAVIVED